MTLPHLTPDQEPAGERAQPDTRERILDAAQELFVQHGLEGTSMRAITARAGVNLAAVNYHFGSKEQLVEQVLRRRLDDMNRARLATLDALEAGAEGRPLAPEAIMHAFMDPSLEMAADRDGGGRSFTRLLGRAYTEPSRAVRDVIGTVYQPVIERFKAAFHAALPELPMEELVWRMHFMFGTLSYTLAATDTVRVISGEAVSDRDDMDALRRRLVDFALRGLLDGQR